MATPTPNQPHLGDGEEEGGEVRALLPKGVACEQMGGKPGSGGDGCEESGVAPQEKVAGHDRGDELPGGKARAELSTGPHAG